MELKAGVQHYSWGKVGNHSEVARLLQQSCDDFELDENLPYAELWMGTHQSCPSMIKSTGMDLACYISNNVTALGSSSVAKFGKDLPFLFKILSVNQALSIQAHPNKQLAEELHANFPEDYKDSNHKPELAIALTEFKAMCGFRPFEEIQKNLKATPEIKDLVKEEEFNQFLQLKNVDSAVNKLRDLFSNLMKSPQDRITTALNDILARLERAKKLDATAEWIRKLSQQFPNDVGCFGPVFFNILTLKPGQAIFLGANKPHAYLEGDCVECMACSDNVVRAGLTPKKKHVEILCSMLDYSGSPAEAMVFQPEEESPYTRVFRPPVPDFAVVLIEIPKDCNTILPIRAVASIAIFVKGLAHTQQGMICSAGTILFIPANEELRLIDINESITCYQAMANL